MKRLSLILFINCLSLVSYAQSNALNNAKIALNAMFAGLDKGTDKVSTGFLWDIAANIVEVDDYNGSPDKDSVFVDMSLLGDLLQSINSASVNADTICVQSALLRIKNHSSCSVMSEQELMTSQTVNGTPRVKSSIGEPLSKEDSLKLVYKFQTSKEVFMQIMLISQMTSSICQFRGNRRNPLALQMNYMTSIWSMSVVVISN